MNNDRIRELEKIGADAMIDRLILEAEEPLTSTEIENMWDEIRSRIKKNTFGPDSTDYDIIPRNTEQRTVFRIALQTRLATNTEVGSKCSCVIDLYLLLL